jgi:lipoprotein NlpI
VLAATGWSADPKEAVERAQGMLRRGEWTLAIDLLEKSLKETGDADVRTWTARAYHLRGVDHFRAGRAAESVADFDRELELTPGEAAGHWQRGISLYYAGEYQKGVEQFELHRSVNPEDVENAVWHFLCAVRVDGGSVEKARRSLIPVTRDPRTPMREVQLLFAGKGSAEEVLRRAEESLDASAVFYGDLYVGLYLEATGESAKSIEFIKRSAENPASRGHYMGDVARVHRMLRGKKVD